MFLKRYNSAKNIIIALAFLGLLCSGCKALEDCNCPGKSSVKTLEF